MISLRSKQLQFNHKTTKLIKGVNIKVTNAGTFSFYIYMML